MAPQFEFSPAARAIREALLDAAALIVPVRCVACGTEGRVICAGCRRRLAPVGSRRELGDGLAVHAGLDYEGVARRAILALKADGATGIARMLAPALVVAVAAAREAAGTSTDSRDAVLCPIPPSRAALRSRGYDPITVVLRRAGLEVVPVFRAAAPRPTQKALDRDARVRNRAGAFRLATPVAGRGVILVDDVATTGATLIEAARVLRAAGARVSGAAVIASTPLRSSVAGGLSENRPGVGDTNDRRRVR